MSGFKYQKIKHFKRGAKWGDGKNRMCVKCNRDIERGRSRQAVMTAELIDTRQPTNHRFIIPVAYCEEHIPEGITS